MGNAQSVGELIAEHRGLAKMTQDDLSTRAGISKRALESYEQGKRSPPVDVVRALADVLGLPCGVLLGDPLPSAADVLPAVVGAEGTAAVLLALARIV